MPGGAGPQAMADWAPEVWANMLMEFPYACVASCMKMLVALRLLLQIAQIAR